MKSKLQNPGRGNFDVLVMSSPTVDISNLDTSQLTPSDSTGVFQQKVKESSQNLFRLAQQSLEQNSNLKRVIIMEHPPRFDNKMVDPTSLKSKLARLANATLGQLWLNCKQKFQIVIGQHSLEGSGTGAAHMARYKDQTTGRMDGVHHYGRKGFEEFTNSVSSILISGITDVFGTAQAGNHKNNTQARSGHQSETHTQNRFNVFKSNQGNY